MHKIRHLVLLLAALLVCAPAFSALNCTSLTTGTGLTTASITLTAGRLNVACTFAYSFSATVGTTSRTGWDNLGTAGGEVFNASTSRLQCFRHVAGSDSTGTLTWTNTNTGVIFVHSVIECTGHDTSGSNGSGAIVQVVDTSTTGADPNNYNLSLAALGDAANNVVLAAFAAAGAGTPSAAPSSGYTELNETAGSGYGLSVNWQLPGTTTPGTANTSGFADIAGMGIEIKAAGGGGGSNAPRAMHLMKQMTAYAANDDHYDRRRRFGT
jgi:hypothetical protein